MSAFIKGTLVSDTGVMQTTSVGDGQAVPAGAVLIDGIAHAQTGERYVTTWPTSGVVAYHEGRAVRHDGVMVTAESVTPAVFLNGIGMTARGETLVATTGTPRYLAGFGITDAGALLVSNPGFSPLSLFTSGAAGVWYDPSDYSTLFQDSAGTTPVTAVEQPVGLMLDKSQGLVLGSQLAPATTSVSGWVPNANCTIASVSGEIEITATAIGVCVADFLTASPTGVSNYLLTAVARCGQVGGSAYLGAGHGSVPYSAAATSTTNTPLTVIKLKTAGGSEVIRLRFDSTAIGQKAYFSQLSCRELPGNHASQATAASRPVLRARYNQTEYSEQFDNGYWAKLNIAAPTANSVIAPDGTLTAETITSSNSASATTGFYKAVSFAAGSTLSIYAKANTSSIAFLSSNSGESYGVFNLSTGTVISSGNATASMTAVPGYPGWYRLIVANTTVASTYFIAGGKDSYTSGHPWSNGTWTSGNSIYMWGADLRTGPSAGTYQRIAAATDYATAGFAPYLVFDGVDDFLGAAYVQSAYPLTIAAGVNNDIGISNVGIVSVAQTDSIYKQLRDDSSATTAAQDRNAATLAPTGFTVSGNKFCLAQFETSLITHQVNGGTANTLANTNAFGTSANIFVGKTRPAGLFSPARDYGVVITNTVLTAAEKDSLKNWMASKMGVTL